MRSRNEMPTSPPNYYTLTRRAHVHSIRVWSANLQASRSTRFVCPVKIAVWGAGWKSGIALFTTGPGLRNSSRVYPEIQFPGIRFAMIPDSQDCTPTPSRARGNPASSGSSWGSRPSASHSGTEASTLAAVFTKDISLGSMSSTPRRATRSISYTARMGRGKWWKLSCTRVTTTCLRHGHPAAQGAIQGPTQLHIRDIARAVSGDSASNTATNRIGLPHPPPPQQRKCRA